MMSNRRATLLAFLVAAAVFAFAMRWRAPGSASARWPEILSLFDGPGTWYTREGDIDDQVRQRQVPIIGEGQGVYSFVHIDDAAGATAAALECPPERTTSSTETRRLSTCG